MLGRNGSGKSTLVRLLSTLLLHDGGSARIFGHDAFAHPRAVRRLVNRVSVEASFFKRMSPEENLSYAARFYGMTPAMTRERIPAILARVGFPVERSGEPMEDLSRGMQQKVALARALLTSPVLLLLDEPTTGLDPRSKLEVQEFVREIRAEHDATILLCTHDLAEAEALADRVGILDRGELLCLGTVPEVLGALRRGVARGGVLRGHRKRPRRGGRRREGGVRLMLRSELIGLGGVVERNWYLVKRYAWWELTFFFWTVANTMTIVFIAKGVEATGVHVNVNELTTVLLIGAVVWAYLGIIFEVLTETVAWERWEGTIEYTFMAPLSRPGAPARDGRVRDRLRRRARRPPVRGRRRAVRAVASRRELRGRARRARGRVDLVPRHRRDDGGAAADLAGEGSPARVRRAGHHARRLGRLLPGLGAARVDAGALDDLARDLRAARDAGRDPRRRRNGRRSGATSGRCS